MNIYRKIVSLCLTAILLFDLGVTAMAADTGFSDVPANADYAQAVAWCQENGLMAGVGVGRFSPEGTLTRAMLATVLYRANGSPDVSGTPRFTDVKSGEWYSNAVMWADREGLLLGYGRNLFGTNDPVTVEQLDVVMGRYMGQEPPWTGDPARSIPATRAQVAVALYENLTGSAAGQVLIAYFSRAGENYSVGTVEKGNTAVVAEMIAEQTGAELFEIRPVTPYPTNYNEMLTVARNEANSNARPAIADTVEHWENYDTVILGYPIWNGDMPMIVYNSWRAMISPAKPSCLSVPMKEAGFPVHRPPSQINAPAHLF